MLELIEQLDDDALLDEIVTEIWDRFGDENHLAAALDVAAHRVLTVDPVVLVEAIRAVRDAAILGVSRHVALDVIRTLLESATLDDVIVALATWHWPDEESFGAVATESS